MLLIKTTVLRIASLIGTCVLFCGIGIFANDETSSEDYIDKWKKEAVFLPPSRDQSVGARGPAPAAAAAGLPLLPQWC